MKKVKVLSSHDENQLENDINLFLEKSDSEVKIHYSVAAATDHNGRPTPLYSALIQYSEKPW